MTKLGWHFVADKLRDGQGIPPDGAWLVYDGEVKICSSGLHYSERIIDALQWAPGSTICRVEVDDIVEQRRDKGVARKRKILWSVDGEELLREFARLCALDVIDKWDAPEVVVRYLNTGDESLRESARDATLGIWDVAEADVALAAWAVLDASCDAAQSAARYAAYYAAQCAARESARSAARDTQNLRLTEMVIEKHGGCI